MKMPTKFQMLRPNLKGFTLIEILVVIAIIAVLISISIPIFAKARKYAQRATCQGNLKQWGIVLDLYTNDNDNHFFKGPVESDWNDWVEILEPYCKGRHPISCCPLAKKTQAQGGQGIFAAWNDEEGDYGSYGLNAWVCDSHEGVIFDPGAYWKTPTVPEAANVPVFLDAMKTAGWPDQNSVPPSVEGQLHQAPTLAEQMKIFCINRHGRGATNCLFMDCSVRAVGLKELWKLKWHRKFDVNGPWTQAGGVSRDTWPQWMRRFKDY